MFFTPILADNLASSIWAPSIQDPFPARKPSKPSCGPWSEPCEPSNASTAASTCVSSGSDCSDDEREPRHKVASEVLESGATTIMVRNLPTKTTCTELMRLLDGRGFEGDYDFCFLPMDRVSTNCKGYAFVNFLDAAAAARFCSMDGLTFSRGATERISQVSLASTQGVLSTLQRITPTKRRRSASAQWCVCVRRDGEMVKMAATEALAWYRQQ